jgi:hypothetical protein
MNAKNHSLWLFILAVAGTLFSGYMSATKFFSKTCPFSEPCAYFLGVPACYFGFFMFAGLLVLSGVQLFKKKILLTQLLLVSAAGILFSGYYSVSELVKCAGTCHYSLGLPTCAYGLVFYIAEFVIAACLAKHEEKKVSIKKKPAAKKKKVKRK